MLMTQRLVLRQWQTEDFGPFAKMNADPQVMEHFPSVLTEEQSNAFALRLQSAIAERGWGYWAVEEKHGGSFIGFVGLNIPAVTLPFSPCVDVGWRLAREYWGRGFATEAAMAAMQFGFETLHLPEIVSFTAVGNTRSQLVMERLGMQRQDEEFDHPAVPVGHAVRRHCWYALKRNPPLAYAGKQADKGSP
jgi:RimJ/RimL family protein N-acetyltransferase